MNEACDKCAEPGPGAHSCPYQRKINDNDDPEFCNCCADCRSECLDDLKRR